ncbi:MAG: hypothetical protein K8J31_05855 [Anaerolineae bacterium]|nr:hypothetical protein [Anaerolineae bacterium]
MRRLHQVGKHEKFVASGIYAQLQQDTPTGLVESWSIHDIGGAQFVRVDRDGRLTDGRSILGEFLRTPEGRIERVDMQAYGGPGDATRLIRMSYIFYEARVEVIRIVNHGQRSETEVALLPGFGIEVSFSILTGFMIAQAASQKADSLPIFAPVDIFTDPGDYTGAVRQVARPCLQGEDVLDIAGKLFPVYRYQWAVEAGGQVATFWLDAQDTLLRSQTDDADTMVLTQYARRPEPHA